MTRACIYFGHHNHPIFPGVCRDALGNFQSLIGHKVSNSPTAKTFANALAASIEFFPSFLLHDDDNGPNTLKGSLLNDVMDQYTVLSSFNICNTISSFCLQSGDKG